MSSTETDTKPVGQKDDSDLEDFEKELDNFIETEEKSKKEKLKDSDSDKDGDKPEKGQQETQGTDKKKNFANDSGPSDNEDSEPDDYNITDGQRRALAELDTIKNGMGFPDEDPPEYDVKERLIELNKSLAEDPTPVEKQGDSRVGFKENLVDLVAPPQDFSDDEDIKSPKSGQNTQKSQDKKDKSAGGGPREKVLIERDGQFELVNSDDITARDLGLPSRASKKGGEGDGKKHTPAPPGKPRPATANGNTRRSVRVTSAKQRPQSAGQAQSNPVNLDNFNYQSPYAMSPREKELMEERKKALEKKKKDDDKKSKDENEYKQKDNEEAFTYWLKKKREDDRRKKIQEEDDRKKGDKEDREDNYSEDDYSASEHSENEEVFRGWLKEKHQQFKKEKLLKKRQDQEMHEGYYVRSREECDKAYKEWMKHKAAEARKDRASERQKARMHRLAARRSRRSQTLARAIRQSQAFRYVDYYGYRF